ncbi:hypothetical protein HNQ64_000273 [Prosthecobacter dejongeii]|uniref:Uncharacterized protein n=1 Tax=Prosthecobacter dejongeii TaxID=48465 RepID=A0A7W7YH48_9BACT|nr:hypothetical protein [Prosthecobacter dejongeii]
MPLIFFKVMNNRPLPRRAGVCPAHGRVFALSRHRRITRLSWKALALGPTSPGEKNRVGS